MNGPNEQFFVLAVFLGMQMLFIDQDQKQWTIFTHIFCVCMYAEGCLQIDEPID